MLRLVPCHSDRFGLILSKKYEFVLPTTGQFMSLTINFGHQIYKYFLWVETSTTKTVLLLLLTMKNNGKFDP